MATNGSNTLANELMTSLNSGVSFTVPTVTLTGPDYTLPADTMSDPVALTNDDLTTSVVGGTGVFDTLMAALDAHLMKEYEAGRITGDQYAKAYIELTTAAMGNAVQFLLSRDQAYWQAMLVRSQARIAEIGAVTAAVELETAKTQRQLVAYQAVTQEAEYALTKVKLANEDITYAINNYKFTQLMPQEKLLLTAQTTLTTNQGSQVTAETAGITYKTSNLMPAELAQIQAQTTLLGSQDAQVDAETAILSYRLINLLPAELAQLGAQTTLLSSQDAQVDAETSILTYRLANILPKEALQLTAQTTLTTNQGLLVATEEDIAAYKLGTLMPKESTILTNQADKLVKESLKITEDTTSQAYQRTDIMPAQKSLLTNQAATALAQVDLVKEQMETARAQTLDTRSNLSAVAGVVGKQKELLTQQKTSYQRDSEIKGAKMYLDAFITQKTIDEATTVPANLSSTNISTVFGTLKTNLGL